MESKEDNQFYQFGQSILKEKKIKGELIFFCTAGSHSFNLNVESSDSDYFGVYEVDVDVVLSENTTSLHHLIDGHEPVDFVMFEIGKFAELLLKGNPKLIEPLFTVRNCYASEKWNRFVQDRQRYISQQVIYHYVSYAKTMMGDAIKLTGGATNSTKSSKKTTAPSTEMSSNHSPNKKLYHTIRLLNETIRMLDGGVPEVYLTGQHRDYIMSIRRGEIPINTLEQEVKRLYGVIDEKMELMKTTNPNSVPIVADSKIISDWIVECRSQTLLNQLSSSSEEEQTTLNQSFESNDLSINLDNQSNQVIEIYNRAKDILKNNNKLEDTNILFVGRSGSHLHGLQVEDSTDDWIVVFSSSLRDVLSLDPLPTRIDCTDLNNNGSEGSSNNQVRDTYSNGLQLMEISYFISLLSQSNHRVVELFYTNNSSSTSSVYCKAWEQLMEINHLTGTTFSHHCWGISQSHLSKAKAMLKLQQKSENDEKDQPQQDHLKQISKHLYHAYRLLNMSDQVLNKKNLEVYISSESDRDIYLSIRNNHEQLDKYMTECTELSNRISLALTTLNPKSKKKENNNNNLNNHRVLLGNWLSKLRKSNQIPK